MSDQRDCADNRKTKWMTAADETQHVMENHEPFKPLDPVSRSRRKMQEVLVVVTGINSGHGQITMSLREGKGVKGGATALLYGRSPSCWAIDERRGSESMYMDLSHTNKPDWCATLSWATATISV